MEFIYNYNALPFYSEEDIILRQRFVEAITHHVSTLLLKTNKAWQITRIEAPSLIPASLINQEYTEDKVWTQDEFNKKDDHLVLKPETTSSTYAWLNHHIQKRQIQLPICVWQLSKSFRREQDQPTKHCRFSVFG